MTWLLESSVRQQVDGSKYVLPAVTDETALEVEALKIQRYTGSDVEA